MLFHTPIFLAFLLAVLALLAIARGAAARRWILLVASYLFYAHWDWRFLSLIAISTAIDFTVANQLARQDEPGARKSWLLLSLGANLGFLACFKYGGFFLAQLDTLTGLSLADSSPLPAVIPVGISFYTFQTLSYTIDVYRRRIEPCRGLVDFALYVAFFPQLVAGPIARAHELLPQLERPPEVQLSNIAAGLQRFVLGVFKKIVIADNAAAYVDQIFAAPGDFSAEVLWCGAFAFALQIYYDFSGYTDMALGLGRMLGITLPENFRAPYLSRSITEFWQRWHISLSSWLRDYLYISLGGNRGGRLKTYRNLMLTMLLGGLWHGTAWTFVLWGGIHGGLLAIERATGWRSLSLGRWGEWLKWALTLTFATLAWIPFRATSFASCWEYLTRMFSAWGDGAVGLDKGLWWVVLFFGLLGAEQLMERYRLPETLWPRVPAFAQAAALAGLTLLISYFQVDDVAFIYFQF